MTKHTRLALVTGSSRGIGKAIALDFAKNGLDILVTGRNETRLQTVKREIEDNGVKGHMVSADLCAAAGLQ